MVGMVKVRLVCAARVEKQRCSFVENKKAILFCPDAVVSEMKNVEAVPV